jgi:hypothetical protein
MTIYRENRLIPAPGQRGCFAGGLCKSVSLAASTVVVGRLWLREKEETDAAEEEEREREREKQPEREKKLGEEGKLEQKSGSRSAEVLKACGDRHNFFPKIAFD